MDGPPTLTDIALWPATVDVPAAGAVFGLSRSHSYELVSRGEFPAKVIKVGSRYRVITASIIDVLSGHQLGPLSPAQVTPDWQTEAVPRSSVLSPDRS